MLARSAGVWEGVLVLGEDRKKEGHGGRKVEPVEVSSTGCYPMQDWKAQHRVSWVYADKLEKFHCRVYTLIQGKEINSPSRPLMVSQHPQDTVVNHFGVVLLSAGKLWIGLTKWIEIWKERKSTQLIVIHLSPSFITHYCTYTHFPFKWCGNI